MDINQVSPTVVMADDDVDEYFLLKEGLEKNHFDCDLRHVPNGKELMDYLLSQGKFNAPEQGCRPLIILLDLNLPEKNGRDILFEIRSIPQLQHIPVIIYTSSTDEEDVRWCYAAGANSYIIKPAGWDQLNNMVRNIFPYWTRAVRLPNAGFMTSPR